MITPARVLIYFIELINCYAAVYYSNFVFFYLRFEFGFGEAANLLTAALGGLVYIIASWQGGKFADRSGCLKALYFGFTGVILSMALGMLIHQAYFQVFVYCLWTAGICFVWPALEALISVDAGAQLSNRVGLYNVTWAAGGAVGYFTTGLLLERLGMASLFWLPLLLTVLQVLLMPYISGLMKKEQRQPRRDESVTSMPSAAENGRFLRMAWLANPFSYVAINTVIPLIPSVAARLSLSTGMAGIVCSIWMFARLFAFATLWRWTAWHYRFRWLAGSFLLIIVCFFGFLMARTIGILIIAEIGFGIAIGLVYYSSLYYSMNQLDNQGANAGLHEAMIGGGLFLGPAIGAVALYLTPAVAGIGAWSVGGFLCAGFSGLLIMRRRKMKA